MDISATIKKLCEDRKISVNSLEKATGIGRGNIGRWDRVSPSFDKVAAVADHLDVSLDELAGRSVTARLLLSDLSEPERELVLAFRDLNSEAQAFLLDNAILFASSDKYKKAPAASA